MLNCKLDTDLQFYKSAKLLFLKFLRENFLLAEDSNDSFNFFFLDEDCLSRLCVRFFTGSFLDFSRDFSNFLVRFKLNETCFLCKSLLGRESEVVTELVAVYF